MAESWENDDDISVTLDRLRSIDGSMLVFQGHTEEGDIITFAVDHRPGAALLDAMADLSEEGDTPVCLVPPWAILSRLDAEVAG